MLVIDERAANRSDCQGYFDGSLELLRELAVTNNVDAALPRLSAIVSKMLPHDALRMACFDQRGRPIVHASTADVPDMMASDVDEVIIDDLEVLLRLRLPSLVGRDDEQQEGNGSDPGEHRANEPLVPRDVDEGEDRPAPPGVGEAEVDRDPPRLLLGEPVGVGPRQRPHEGALAVVDVSRGADESSRHAGSIRDRGPGGMIRRS